jgi:hypothetical protein
MLYLFVFLHLHVFPLVFHFKFRHCMLAINHHTTLKAHVHSIILAFTSSVKQSL